MRESLKDFFEGVSIKKTLFLIIWTAGILGYIYFWAGFQDSLKLENWAYSEAMKIHQQNAEIKIEKEDGAAGSNTASLVQPTSEEGGKEISSPSPEGIEKKIYEKFGKENYQIARAVAFAESRLNPIATNTNTNGTTDTGIFQINSCHCKTIGADCEKKLIDPSFNIEFAYQLFQKSGWKPWTTFSSGKYLAYVND